LERLKLALVLCEQTSNPRDFIRHLPSWHDNLKVGGWMNECCRAMFLNFR
jgi:hypothetical protein